MPDFWGGAFVGFVMAWLAAWVLVSRARRDERRMRQRWDADPFGACVMCGQAYGHGPGDCRMCAAAKVAAEA